MLCSVPSGLNIPKAALAFAAAASALIAACFALLALLFGLSGSPDFTLSSLGVEGVAAGLAPVALAAFCAWLLRAHAEAIGRAGRDVRVSANALLWLVDLALAFALCLYFLADAGHGARYHDVLVDPIATWTFALVAFAVACACALAIARSFRGLFALGLLALLAVALEASEALDVWLGVDGL
jgi:small-conductance mechanosensitive channel